MSSTAGFSKLRYSAIGVQSQHTHQKNKLQNKSSKNSNNTVGTGVVYQRLASANIYRSKMRLINAHSNFVLSGKDSALLGKKAED
jgi:hypothetical protein